MCLNSSSSCITITQNHENVVRCRDEIKDWVSSGEPRVSDGMIGYLAGDVSLIKRCILQASSSSQMS